MCAWSSPEDIHSRYLTYTSPLQSQVTTTLQALVNLKRPTIRLSPLSPSPSSETQTQHHHHGLEFEYDCDAPKCGIYVSVLLAPSHPESSTHSSPGLTKTLVFESIVPGGFGKKLTLDEGAVLELARFEHRPAAAPPVGSLENTVAQADGGGDTAAPRPSKRRFSNFHFRRRDSLAANVSGPALAVVDAESAPNPDSAKAKEDAEEEFLGVRVTIRVAALDAYGAELGSPNEQVTYLEVVRLGAAPEHEEGAGEEEDTRSWVVRVVKREASVCIPSSSLFQSPYVNSHTRRRRSAHTHSTSTKSTASPPNRHTPPRLPPPSPLPTHTPLPPTPLPPQPQHPYLHHSNNK